MSPSLVSIIHLHIRLFCVISALLLTDASGKSVQAKDTFLKNSMHQAQGELQRFQSIECNEKQDALAKQKVLRDIKKDSEGALLTQYMNAIARKRDNKQHWSDAFIMRAQEREAKGQFEKAAADARQFFALRP